MSAPLDLNTIQRLFTNADGAFEFARWGRPIAPVIFGVDDATLAVLRAAIEQTVAITGQTLAQTDPELGANFIWIFCANWDEVKNLPDIDQLLPNWDQTVHELNHQSANSYRYMTYDADDGAIQFCAVVIRIAGAYGDQPISVIGMGQTLQSLCRFAPNAFGETSPLAMMAGRDLCVIKPEFSSLLRAAYDPVLPNASTDRALALRIKARADIIWAGADDGA